MGFDRASQGIVSPEGAGSVEQRLSCSNKGGATLRDVLKRLNAIEQGAKQKLTLSNHPASVRFYVEGTNVPGKKQQRYIALPVTEALLPQYPGTFIPSDKYRKGRKVRVRGVKLRFRVVHKHGVRVSGVAHQMGGSPAVSMLYGSDGVPQTFQLGMKVEEGVHRMYSLEETGFLQNRGGPFQVEAIRGTDDMQSEIVNENVLGCADGSIFECPTVKGDGAPIGKVEFSVGSEGDPGFHKDSGRR